MKRIENDLYFSYGSNMNLDQMAYRCPAAEVIGKVQLPGYELAFCGCPGSGVATIKPRLDGMVEGVLWRITEDCEKSLDFYEGFPHLYGKEALVVEDNAGNRFEVMAYTMHSPFCHREAVPSQQYLQGILDGCRQNGIAQKPILQAYNKVRQETILQRKREEKRKYPPTR